MKRNKTFIIIGFMALLALPICSIAYAEPAAQQANAEGTVEKGDVNGDGIVNSADIMALANYILGKAGGINKEAADLTNDNKLSIADIVALIALQKDNDSQFVYAETDTIGSSTEYGTGPALSRRR